MELNTLFSEILITILLVLIVSEGILFFIPFIKFKLYRKRQPRISVLLCARNEEKHIKQCILSILEQDYPDFEILISDDQSTDETVNIIKSISSELVRFFQFEVTNYGEEVNPKSRQLHELLPEATGELIAIADADCIYEKNWLSSLQAAMGEKYDMISGVTKVKGSFIQNLEWITSQGRIILLHHKNSRAALGNNMMLVKEKLEAIGGFSSALHTPTEDMRLNTLFKKCGFRTIFLPKVLATTHAVRFFKLFQQRKRWTSGLKEVPVFLRIVLFGQLLLPLWVGLLCCFSGFLGLKLWLIYTAVKLLVDIRLIIHFDLKSSDFKLIIYELYRQVFSLLFFLFHIIRKDFVWKQRKYRM